MPDRVRTQVARSQPRIAVPLPATAIDGPANSSSKFRLYAMNHRRGGLSLGPWEGFKKPCSTLISVEATSSTQQQATALRRVSVVLVGVKQRPLLLGMYTRTGGCDGERASFSPCTVRLAGKSSRQARGGASTERNNGREHPAYAQTCQRDNSTQRHSRFATAQMPAGHRSIQESEP